MNSLVVSLGELRAGELIRKDNGNMQFRYRDDYSGPPLSCSMPVQATAHPHATCRAVFGGLLPEGDGRAMIARRFGVSAGNDFALLAAIGGDCAGAIELTDPGVERNTEVKLKRLDEPSFERLVRDLPARPLAVDTGDGIRLSLAGAQPKLPIVIDADGYALPASPAAASTHIVKPEPPGFPGLVDNEAFCLALANDCGLPAARARKKLSRDGLPYLIVERFDRTRSAGVTKRVHQEDFCQALAFAPERKYQADGGPGVAESAELIRAWCAAPARDLQTFWSALVLNWLIGNCDAHAKNYSLLISRSGPALAPLYDLVSTVAYPQLSTRFAMRVGGAAAVDKIGARDWDELASTVGLDARFAARIAADTRERTRAAAARLGAHPDHANETARRIADRVIRLGG